MNDLSTSNALMERMNRTNHLLIHCHTKKHTSWTADAAMMIVKIMQHLITEYDDPQLGYIDKVRHQTKHEVAFSVLYSSQ